MSKRAMSHWLHLVLSTTTGRLAMILFAGLLLRLLSVYFGVQTILIDPVAYQRDSSVRIPYELAENMLQGRGFSNSEGPTVFWPPLYPVFLAAIQFLFGKEYAIVWLLQALLGTLTILFTYLLARAIHSGREGLWAAGIVSLYPSLIVYAHLISAEVLCLFLVTISLWLATSALKRQEWPFMALSGVFGGLGILARTEIMLGAFVLGLACIFWPRRILFKALLIWAAFAGMVLLPWLVRNYRLTGHITPIATNAGYNLFLGNNPRTPFHVWDAEDDKVILEWYKSSGPNDYDRYTASVRMALGYIVEHPIVFVQRGVGRVLDNWSFERLFLGAYRAGYYGTRVSLPILVIITGAMFASQVGLHFSAAIGIVFGPKDRCTALLIALPIYSTIVAFLAFTYPRVTLPLVSALATLGSRPIANRLRNIRSPHRLIAVGVGIAFFAWLLLREILWGEFDKLILLFH